MVDPLLTRLFQDPQPSFFHRHFAPKLVLDDSMNRTTVVTVLGRFCLEGCSMNI